jgi:hypothetical protein
MSEVLPVLYVARHGETAWSLSGQHTGLIDLPLTPNGERNAQRLGERLKGMTFAKVFTSPLLWPRLILIWWNGTTVNMKGGGRPKSSRNARTGNCSGTAVREASRQHKWARGRTVSSGVSARFPETYCSFPADTSFEFLPPAGWRLVRDPRAGTFS